MNGAVSPSSTTRVPSPKKWRASPGSGLILGSATPSLDAYHRAEQRLAETLGNAGQGFGTRRAATVQACQNQDRPRLKRPRTPRFRPSRPSTCARSCAPAIAASSAAAFSQSFTQSSTAGEQAILFLNRRGTHTFVICRDCGLVANCPRCDTPLTFHERAAQLICHRCNAREPIPSECPDCGSKRIRYFGSGTQRIEELVSQISPRARLLRWDRDTTGRRGSHEQILERFAAHEADVLIGTQMIAKGLDLPLVTLGRCRVPPMSDSICPTSARLGTDLSAVDAGGRPRRAQQTRRPRHLSELHAAALRYYRPPPPTITAAFYE